MYYDESECEIMKYEIRIFGDPILREKSVPVKEVSDDLLQLAEDMIATMHANSGAGLAAQQIGRTERICIVNIDDDLRDEGDLDVEGLEMPLILINPEIMEMSGKQTGQEGCLSFPEIFVKVARSDEVTLRYLDVSGENREIKVGGFLARAVQHEVDHLNGVLLVDHMSPVQKVAIAGKLKRMKKQALTK